MTTHDLTQQALLELHYGLLSDTEAELWRQRIATDPRIACAWSDVLTLADRLGQAARLEGVPHTPLSAGPAELAAELADARAVPPVRVAPAVLPKIAVEPKPGSDSPRRVRVPWTWFVLTSTAAVLLYAGFSAVAYFSAVDRLPPLALRLVVDGQRPLENSPANVSGPEERFAFTVRTLQADERPAVSTVSFAVSTPQVTLWRGGAVSDRSGSIRVPLPTGLPIPPGATLTVSASSIQGRTPASASATVPLEPTRCNTHLSVDKPWYRPGETIFYRSLTLERFALTSSFDVPLHFELRDPSGAVVPGSVREGVTERGVGNGAFALPQSAVGGEYVLVARSLDGFFPEVRRPVLVRQFRNPRFRTKLDFERDSYGPGDLVLAEFSAERIEGGSLAGAKLTIQATLDGRALHQATVAADATGRTTVSFRLPDLFGDGRGELAIVVDDGAARETTAKTIPIRLGKVLVDFYPEGGDLVAGLENRVYFAARTPFHESVHIAGEVLDDRGESVASLASVRDGLGQFRFRPEPGRRYSLKIARPLDVTTVPELPRPTDGSLVLDTGAGVFAAAAPITFAVRSKSRRTLVAVARCRGQDVAETTLIAGDDDVTHKLTLPADVGGVVRLTLLDGTSTLRQPLAERLVYRRSARNVSVKVVEHGRDYSPGQPLRLTLQTRDERGQPVAAVLGVSVVDDAVLGLATKPAPTLRTHFLLTSEVQRPEDLEDANFYLGDEPEAAAALDLLLGTQGWRRFVGRNVTAPLAQSPAFQEEVRRLVELGTQPTKPVHFDNRGEVYQRALLRRQQLDRALTPLVPVGLILLLMILTGWLTLRFISRMTLDPRFGLLLLAAGLVPFVGCAESNMPASNDLRDAKTASAPRATTRPTMTEQVALPTAEPMGNAPASRPAMPEPAGESPPPPTEPNASMGGGGGVLPAPGLPTNVPSTSTPWDTAPIGGPRSAVVADATRVLSHDELRRLLTSRGYDAASLTDQLLAELRFPIREYSHRHQPPGQEPNVRRDFTETLFWNPLLVTDARGEATLRFDLSDSVTRFRVQVDAHTADGRIGSGGGTVVSRLPFQLDPKLPLEVTAGDKLDVPVAISNYFAADLPVALTVLVDGPLVANGETTANFALPSNGRRREHFSYDVPNGRTGVASIEVRGSAGAMSDAVRRTVPVTPSGYPVQTSLSGVLDGTARVRLPVPSDALPGSLAVTLRAYPSPLADMQQGLESLLSEPHGCFEQASSTNYPNTMVLRYLQEHRIVQSDVSDRARKLLTSGYRRLTSYECRERGFEWFGADPGHEALTAFGLLQFHDMAAVFEVDTTLLIRTREWLLGRRDGEGSFRRNARHLHQWSVEQSIVDAYIVWAITESERAGSGDVSPKSEISNLKSDLSAELAKLESAAASSSDPYFLALVANSLLNVGRVEPAEKLLERLESQQAADGSLTGRTTVTQSGGLSRNAETTSLAALAWLKHSRFRTPANRAVNWLASNRRGGGFGSTQATVLALKAFVAHARLSGRGDRAGTLTVSAAGKPLGTATLPTGESRVVELPRLAAGLAPGEVELELSAADYGRLPYAIDVAYHTSRPPSDSACPVTLSTKLAETKLRAGATVTLHAELKNTTAQGLPMTVAVLGLPAGLEPRVEQLDELKKTEKFDYYELRARELIFYWRTLAPNAGHAWNVTLTATVPGRYTGPASRTYLYYTAEQKMWTPPLEAEIARE